MQLLCWRSDSEAALLEARRWPSGLINCWGAVFLCCSQLDLSRDVNWHAALKALFFRSERLNFVEHDSLKKIISIIIDRFT